MIALIILFIYSQEFHNRFVKVSSYEMISSYFAAWKHCPVYRQHTGQEEQCHEQLVTRALLLLS